MPSETSSTPDEEGAVEEDGDARRWKLLSALFAVALIACLVAAFVLWRDRSDLQDEVEAVEQQQDDAEAAEVAAREFVTQLTTYSSTTIDAMCEQIDEAATADFLEGGSGVCSPAAVKLVKEGPGTNAEGGVLNAAAKPVEGGRFEVLLFTDQEVTGQSKTDCFLEETRLVVTMVEQDSRWLVDNLEIMNYLGGQNRLPCEKAG